MQILGRMLHVWSVGERSQSLDNLGVRYPLLLHWRFLAAGPGKPDALRRPKLQLAWLNIYLDAVSFREIPECHQVSLARPEHPASLAHDVLLIFIESHIVSGS